MTQTDAEIATSDGRAADPSGARPAAGRPLTRTAMHARAALSTARSDTGATRIVRMRSQAPLVLRPTRVAGRDEPALASSPGIARVALAAGAAGPVGGDRVSLDIEVGRGSTLVLSDVSARLLLPGPHGEQSRTTTTVHVADGGTFVWLPRPAIAAKGCHHVNDIRVTLDDGARLLLREEVVLGRHGELPGALSQHVRVELAGRALYDQRLDFGPDAQGWSSPAVTGRNRAVGSVLVVDPAWAAGTPATGTLAPDGAVLPLAGPAVLITAVSADSLALRRTITAGLAGLGPPWSTPAHE